ncbi:hypothetical protein PFISCL1PPCAC_21685, partial [Pristionchus fissidentatus]
GAAKSIQGPNDLQRLAILFAKTARVEAHNANPDKTFTLAVNKFAVLTPQEYKSLNGLLVPAVKPVSNWDAAAATNIAIPDEVDWRKEGIVSPVKDQGLYCGSCYAFASVGALEGQHAKKRGAMLEFSEQNIVDCSKSYGNHGCHGGFLGVTYNYIKMNGGIDTEVSYPYNGDEEKCRFRNATIGETDEGSVYIPEGDEEALKTAVATVGPISVGINASGDGFKLYSDGVYYEEECDPEGINHAVLIVGYGTDETGGDYWLVKNSWGTDYGDDGYIKMARNRGNFCGIASMAYYPIV